MKKFLDFSLDNGMGLGCLYSVFKLVLLIAIAIILFVLLARCNKPVECKTVTQTRTNTRTGVTDTLMNEKIICGHGLNFLKNGTYDSFTYKIVLK